MLAVNTDPWWLGGSLVAASLLFVGYAIYVRRRWPKR
jgi:ABC-type multidrug transport system permease subunit